MLPNLREACGVFGVYAPGEDVARITFFGLYALQHRGQESAGIATSNARTIYLKTGMGLVSQVFDEDDLSYLPGNFAIGHTRYSTTGSSRLDNAQPIRVSGPNGELALGHNGNIVNAQVVREELPARRRRVRDDERLRSHRADCSRTRPASTGRSAGGTSCAASTAPTRSPC